MTLKISVGELEDLAIEGVMTTADGVNLRVVDEGEWIGGGKYEDKTIVFTDGERLYRGTVSRSGSYYTDWTWNSEWDSGDADIEEVAAVPVTVTQYQPVLERGYQVYDSNYPEEGHYFTAAEPDRLVTVIGPAVRTESGWHAIKEAAN